MNLIFIKEKIKKIIPYFFIDFYHFILAFLGAVLYGFPSRKLKVVGVTGTNGKTTTTEMIAQIMEEAGFKVALMNSIRFKIGSEEEKNMLKMTMPGRFFIQRFLRKALKAGCNYVILEVTSEGIKQSRHRFIKFDSVIFTNLSPEHIESHGSFEKYRQAKGELFKRCKNIHIINIDDASADYFLKFPSAKKFLYSQKDKDSLLDSVKLVAEFNLINALAASKVCLAYGVDWKICKKGISKVQVVPGRMEEVVSKPFKVIVDYAFTPNSLEKVYQELTKELKNKKEGRLICVLGSAGGGRDKWKRPVLGEIASKYCSKVIITNEDPYDEDPEEIINQVAKGAKQKAEKILDRRVAINYALKSAKPKDIVIITGKGSEPWICLEKGKKIPWDDKKAVREEFEKLKLH